jgi:hypothetical protein
VGICRFAACVRVRSLHDSLCLCVVHAHIAAQLSARGSLLCRVRNINIQNVYSRYIIASLVLVLVLLSLNDSLWLVVASSRLFLLISYIDIENGVCVCMLASHRFHVPSCAVGCTCVSSPRTHIALMNVCAPHTVQARLFVCARCGVGGRRPLHP